ncbi:hypothetical protein [Nocardioides sp. GY 10113]|uniref:hypothetical protein n=1 Tax=Nocardioides sp. GY 10113 TaxID=2569761 RepID=UPI00145871B4|nr:hypothetical protein [Nocardioides sp. GY 10113]
MRRTVGAADSRTVHTWDGLVLFWVALWVVVGAWTGVTLWQAADAGDTISRSGRATSAAGEGLASMADVPLVGDRPGEIGRQIAQSGTEITARGQEVKGQLRQLALLLGISITVIPIASVAALYLPPRLARHRTVVSLRRSLAESGMGPALEGYLAAHAMANLPVEVVLPLVTSARMDDDARRRLARAELARLGISVR